MNQSLKYLPLNFNKKCIQCEKSLLCEKCGQIDWNKLRILENAVDDWWFCSENCKNKFMEK